jgi:cytoskeleton-associated protein 5
MADDEAKLLADAKKLPLEERVSHPNWKVRSEAFEDIKTSCTKAFSTADPIFDQSGMLYMLMMSGNGETERSKRSQAST